MAKFKIYSASGVEKAVGYLSFTGTYMKAGVLDFREIASPTPIAWAIGDYVDYTRTGRRYKLYTIPQVKKQARSSSYGGAFIYQNVQFFDDSHQGDICPFRDLVPGDNRVHFSTQPQISVFDNVAGIAERLQACLEDMYGAGSWVVRTATAQDGAPQELLDLMADEREFVVSGVSVTGALEKVYEIWPEVGFVYTIENGVNTLIIGGAGLNANEDTYKYGKGYGLTSLSKVVANADDMANRLYVYGSARNMLARWYSQFDIKDADSVDIQHLMLPISVWGETDGKPDPAKAFIETEDAEANLRPKTVYFDGSGDLKEIYPTIRENTIQDLWDVMPEGADYRPDTSVWDGDERIDKLLSAQATFDSGLAANNGKSAIQNISWDAHVSSSTSQTIRPNISVPLFARDFTLEEAGSLNFDIVLNVNGTIALPGAQRVVLRAMVHKGSAETYPKFIDQSIELEKSVDSDAFILAPASFSASRVQFDPTRTILVSFFLEIATNASTGTATLAIDMDGSLNVAVSRYRAKTFTVSLRQLGFDISAQADLGEGKTMVMRSGKCVGRAFKISSTAYNSATDTWDVELIRSNDESLSQWFPNSTYPVEADDEFVLTEIAMPGIYISLAEIKLLAAARELLADTSKEQWQYTPDIDAKFMVESGRTILPATNVTIEDEIVPGGSVSMLVDSVTISEGDAAIPIYKVTLRDKKRKSYSDKASVQETSSVPVSTPAQTASKAQRTVINDSFFEEDGDGGIKLKDKYTGLWAEGFMTAGGIGSGGGGGGEGATLLEVWRSLTNNPSLVDSDITPALAIAAAHIPIGNGLTINPQTGLIDATTSGTVISVAGVSPVDGDVPKDSLIDALGLDIVSKCLQSLQSQIDSVASKDDFDELNVTVLHADMLSASGIYAEAITLGGSDLSATLNGLSTAIGNEATARANADSALASGISALNGYFTNGAANNALKLGGQLPSYYATASALSGVSDRLAVLEARQNWDEIFGIDENGDVYIKQYQEGGETKSRGFWGYSFITAGGVGSGGGGGDGASLLEVWRSLTNNPELVDSDITSVLNIASLHIPIGNGLVINSQTGLIDVTVRGGVTSVAGMTGDISAAQLATALGISDLDDKLSIISVCLQSLQSQIDSVASRNEFDELVATAFHADIITTPSLYAEVVSLNGVDLNTRLVGISADIASEALARASADTTLTGAVNDVASRATALEGRASSLETRATALEGRADSLEDKFDANGNAKSALKLTTVSKTIWGQTYWTSGGVPQNVTAAPNLYIGGSKVQTSQAAQVLIGILSISAIVSPGETDETKIEWDADAHAWHFHGGLYADSFIVAGGTGSGGGGGSTDLSDMWLSLKTNEDEFANEKIHVDHIPSLSWGKITTGKPTTLLGYGITDAYTKLEVDNLIGAIDQFHYEIYPSLSDITTPAGNVLYLIGPTGSGSDKYEEYVYANGSFTKIGDTTIDLSPYLTIASAQATYQPIISDLATIKAQAAHGETAYNSLGTISDCLQSLQSQIDSVASRDEFDELTATVLFADMISTPSIYVETLSLNGSDLAGALSNLSSRATSLEGRASSLESRATSLEGRATSLEGKFTGDSANSALRLAGTSAYSIWGVEYWASGVPKSVTGRPGLFIGSAQVQTSNSPQALAGITTLTASGLATIAGGISLGGTLEGVDSKIVWDATNSAWHLIGNFYADGFIVAGGTGSGGGGGDVDLDRVWESLTNNTDFPNVKILGTHIPDMASTYGYLKGNQTITLTGVVTGSGATTIATSIANNALSISMVNGLQAALDSKTGNLGTVTSVGLSMPTGFSVSGSPITDSGTLSVSFASGYSLLTSTQISTWNGKQDAISDLSTIRTNAANGATAYGWGNHASAGYFKASSFTAANIASTLGNTAVNRATADASGENISDKFGIVGVALQSLQSQIDSLATKNAFDELSVTVLNADMVTATTAYLETIYGSLQGNALTASYLYSQSYSAGSPVNPVYFTSGRPASCSYSFGNASGNAPINNGILNTNLWANYATCDSSNENISDKFGIVSVALQSIQSQVDSVASRDSFDELSATILHADMLTVGAQVNVSGSIFSDEGIYTNGYLTGGGVVSSSDRRLKDEITKVDAERAWEVLMALNPVEWVWNENNAHLYGRRSAGLVAQEVFDVLPYSVFHDGKYDALRYDVFHAFEIAGLQDHEARIRTLEAENKEFKRQVELLTR